MFRADLPPGKRLDNGGRLIYPSIHRCPCVVALLNPLSCMHTVSAGESFLRRSATNPLPAQDLANVGAAPTNPLAYGALRHSTLIQASDIHVVYRRQALADAFGQNPNTYTNKGLPDKVS